MTASGEQAEEGLQEVSAEAGPQALPWRWRAPGFSARLAGRIGLVRFSLAATFERELEEGRGVLWLPVFFGTGIVFYFALPAEPALPALGVLTLALAAAAWRAGGSPAAFRLLVPLALLAAGTSAAKLRTDLVAAPRLEQAMIGETDGWIAGLEQSGTGGARLLLRVRAIEGLAPEATPRLVRVTLRTGAAALSVGDGVTMLAALRPPLAPLLPGGHDFGRVDYYAGIGGSGFAYGTAHAAEIGPPPFPIRLGIPLARLRAAIEARIAAALPGQSGRIAIALVTGDQRGIPESTQEALRASGLAHVLSISGLHMALVAGTVFWVTRALLALIPGLALRRPIKKWAAALALLIAAGYLVLSGAEVPAQRSFLMLAVMLAAILFDRRAITVRNVALSAFLVLLAAPESLLSVSFQMSFAAALALVSGYEAISAFRSARLEERRSVFGGRVWREISGLFLTSLIAGLATTPFAAFHFQRLAPLSLVANMAAMPAVSFIVMPMALAAVLVMPLGLEALPLAAVDFGLRIMVAVAETVAGWSEGLGVIAMAPASALALLTAGFLWLGLWRQLWRLAGLLPLAAGIVVALTAPRPDILVAADGKSAAVRGADGRYSLLGGAGARYQTDTWLRADGDPRDSHAPDLGAGALCDRLGCTAPLGGGVGRVALALDPEAFADDCAAASAVVASLPAPPRCGDGATVIDATVLGEGGAVALYALEPSAAGPGLETEVASTGAASAPRRPAPILFRRESAYPAIRRPFMSPLPLAPQSAAEPSVGQAEAGSERADPEPGDAGQ